MLRSRESTVSLLLIVALAGLALVISGCAPGAATAPLGALGERSVTVLGRGMVSSKPDLALAGLGVETFAATVAEATEQNNVKMSAVMAKLVELDIAEKDIQTTNFNINFERRGPEDSEGQYRVSNMVQIKVRDLDEVSSILDAAVQAGANQVWGVSFTIEEQKELEAQARTKAMEDARKRAEALAELAGVQLGQVLIVAEGGTTGPIPMMRGLGKGGMEPASLVAPISAGEVQVSYQVEVTYAMQ